jgi:catechol 2,3-dioxygenase-like lactoylglutathione lyase family enzyme
MPAANHSDASVENTIPVLAVKDVQTSLRFYQDKLGFKLDWGGDGATSHIASVSRDGHAIMLQKGEKGSPTTVWIGGPGMLPLYEKCTTNGVTILQPPTNQHYALEMRLEDPDGHILWFGTEPRTDTPFGQRPAELFAPAK